MNLERKKGGYSVLCRGLHSSCPLMSAIILEYHRMIDMTAAPGVEHHKFRVSRRVVRPSVAR